MLKTFRFHNTPHISRQLYHIKIVATEPKKPQYRKISCTVVVKFVFIIICR